MKLSEALDAAGKSIDTNLPYTGMQMHNAADAAREMEQRLDALAKANFLDANDLIRRVAALEKDRHTHPEPQDEKAKEPETIWCGVCCKNISKEYGIHTHTKPSGCGYGCVEGTPALGCPFHGGTKPAQPEQARATGKRWTLHCPDQPHTTLYPDVCYAVEGKENWCAAMRHFEVVPAADLAQAEKDYMALRDQFDVCIKEKAQAEKEVEDFAEANGAHIIRENELERRAEQAEKRLAEAVGLMRGIYGWPGLADFLARLDREKGKP